MSPNWRVHFPLSCPRQPAPHRRFQGLETNPVGAAPSSIRNRQRAQPRSSSTCHGAVLPATARDPHGDFSVAYLPASWPATCLHLYSHLLPNLSSGKAHNPLPAILNSEKYRTLKVAFVIIIWGKADLDRHEATWGFAERACTEHASALPQE